MISEHYTDDAATYIANIPFHLINEECTQKPFLLFLLWLLLIQQFLTSQDF